MRLERKPLVALQDAFLYKAISTATTTYLASRLPLKNRCKIRLHSSSYIH